MFQFLHIVINGFPFFSFQNHGFFTEYRFLYVRLFFLRLAVNLNIEIGTGHFLFLLLQLVLFYHTAFSTSFHTCFFFHFLLAYTFRTLFDLFTLCFFSGFAVIIGISNGVKERFACCHYYRNQQNCQQYDTTAQCIQYCIQTAADQTTNQTAVAKCTIAIERTAAFYKVGIRCHIDRIDQMCHGCYCYQKQSCTDSPHNGMSFFFTDQHPDTECNQKDR